MSVPENENRRGGSVMSENRKAPLPVDESRAIKGLGVKGD
jgi:hypothetical protein